MLIASYAWVPAKSAFGSVDVPRASIELQDVSGSWDRYVFKIDSGAVITAMDFENCEALGLDLEKGKPVNLKGVCDEKGTTYYVHDVNMMIGKKIIQVPVAFSAKKMESSLLGRLQIFNKFGIYFNPKIRHTTFSADKIT